MNSGTRETRPLPEGEGPARNFFTASRPSALNKVASRLLIHRASSPPLRGMLPLILLLDPNFKLSHYLKKATVEPMHQHEHVQSQCRRP
jgi:hypothetical protein